MLNEEFIRINLFFLRIIASSSFLLDVRNFMSLEQEVKRSWWDCQAQEVYTAKSWEDCAFHEKTSRSHNLSLQHTAVH